MSRVTEKVTPGSMGGGWRRAEANGLGDERQRRKRLGCAPLTYWQTVPRQSPTLLRWGNSSRQFSWIDDYVHERLALFDSKKRQKRGRRWGRMHTKAWFARPGIFTLSGTVRYIRTATATT